MAWAFHVAFGGGRAGIEILKDEFLIHVRAPFEKPSVHCLQQGGDFWVAKRLVCKFNGIGVCSHRVGKGGEIDGLGDVRGVWGTIYHTGAGSWQN